MNDRFLRKVKCKMSACKVSVIIATYNTAAYLEECLDSVFSQTLRDMEVVLIDDGSTDDTESILRTYKRKYDNLVTCYWENQGVGNARNYGMTLAKGEYMVFMDPDDKYPCEDCLEKLYLAAKEHDVLICGGNILTNDNGVIGSAYRAGEGDERVSRNQVIDVKEYFYLVGHTRYLFKSEFIKWNQILYANYRRYQDQVFTIKALGAAGQLYELDYPVYEYRINHKRLEIDFDICIDILKGFRDTLKLICEYDLQLMFEKNYEEFINERMPDIARYAFCGRQEFDGVIRDINELVRGTKWYDEKYLVTCQSVLAYKQNAKETKSRLEELLRSGIPLIIYGAGANTRRLLSHYKDWMENVVGIAVSGLIGDDFEVEGIRVRNISTYNSYKLKAVVLITPNTKAKNEIIKKLVDMKFENYEWIDIRFLR